MRIVVLGGSGLVGSYVRVALRDLGEVQATFNTQSIAGLQQLDLRDSRAVRSYLKDMRPDVVVIAAADPHVDGCERDPAGTRQLNVGGVANVVDALVRDDTKVVYFSSDYVFDGLDGPYSEDDPVNPIQEYGRQKVEAEAIVRNMPAHLICRISGVFGWEPRRKNFVCQVIDRLRRGDPVRAANDQILCPTYAVDIAEAVRDLLRRGVTGIVHVVGPEALTRVDFARQVAAAFGLTQSRISAVSTGELGLAARRPMNSALRDYRLRHKLARRLRRPDEALAQMRDHAPPIDA